MIVHLLWRNLNLRIWGTLFTFNTLFIPLFAYFLKPIMGNICKYFPHDLKFNQISMKLEKVLFQLKICWHFLWQHAYFLLASPEPSPSGRCTVVYAVYLLPSLHSGPSSMINLIMHSGGYCSMAASQSAQWLLQCGCFSVCTVVAAAWLLLSLHSGYCSMAAAQSVQLLLQYGCFSVCTAVAAVWLFLSLYSCYCSMAASQSAQWLLQYGCCSVWTVDLVK